MVNTSARPISVDGVRLDTLAWNVEKISRATAGRRSGDYDIPGVDGVVPSLNDALEPASFGLDMWLRGTDADGLVPAAGSMTTLRQNLDELLHLFGQRHKLLDLREQVDAIGTQRRTWAKVADSIAPDIDAPGSSGRFTVALTIPSGQWEDVAAIQWSALAPVVAAEVTGLQGSTERINDAVVLVLGPATNPRVTDPATGMWVELQQALPGGQVWRFNSATWASRQGAGLTFDSLDTTGTDLAGVTTSGGPSRPYGLPLTPARDTGARRVRVTLSAASGIVNGTTQVTVSARRKYGA